MGDQIGRPLVAVKGIEKHYGAVHALKPASFEVHQGEIIALLGPNGAGKTTMMKILTGFMEPSNGHVFVDGINIEEDMTAVQMRIGYLPENAPIYGDMLVQEYLTFAGAIRGLTYDLLTDRIAEAVESTDLYDVLTRPIAELSKGFRQRVGLAQAILHKPKLLILDEPTNGLDPTQIIEIRHLIKRLAENSTVMLSTHILSEAEATCDRAIIISQGEIKADQNLSELAQSQAVYLTLHKGMAGVLNTDDILKTLRDIKGVGEVKPTNIEGPVKNLWGLQISALDQEVEGHELAYRIFEKAKNTGWPICELRPSVNNLEAVFKQLVS